MPKLLLILLIAGSCITVFGQSDSTSGCTDPHAINYKKEAIINDGSCQYPITNHNPEKSLLISSTVNETSGLAYCKGMLWTINDSGGKAALYGIDSLNGEVIREVVIIDAVNHDWESLATDSNYLYVGDFGNNNGQRRDLTIYRINLADLQDTTTKIKSEKIQFTYEDYPLNIKGKKENNYDCEAMIAGNDSLFLFSKNWENHRTRLYALPNSPGEHTAILKDEYNCNGLITGADWNKKTNVILLTGYTDKSWVPFFYILYDYSGNHFLSGNKRRVEMINLPATQVEAVAFTGHQNGWITSEGHKLFSQTAFSFDISKWTTDKPNDTIQSGNRHETKH